LTAPTRIIFDLKAGAAMLGDLTPGTRDTRKTVLPVPKKAAARAAALAAPLRAKPVSSKPKAIHANPDEDQYDGNSAASHNDDIPE
jgi:hypothetical protein